MITLKMKLIALFIYTLVVILGTLYVENKFDKADKLDETVKQLDNSQKVPDKIIKFNQKVRESDASKDDCFNTPMPADIASLLK